ncbi:MAG: hypothetical protein WC333_00830 [Dehalococcoidia bacterium]|jgi:hypothetical protein
MVQVIGVAALQNNPLVGNTEVIQTNAQEIPVPPGIGCIEQILTQIVSPATTGKLHEKLTAPRMLGLVQLYTPTPLQHPQANDWLPVQVLAHKQ